MKYITLIIALLISTNVYAENPALEVCDEVDGYYYLGGDPNEESSWKLPNEMTLDDFDACGWISSYKVNGEYVEEEELKAIAQENGINVSKRLTEDGWDINDLHVELKHVIKIREEAQKIGYDVDAARQEGMTFSQISTDIRHTRILKKCAADYKLAIAIMTDRLAGKPYPIAMSLYSNSIAGSIMVHNAYDSGTSAQLKYNDAAKEQIVDEFANERYRICTQRL